MRYFTTVLAGGVLALAGLGAFRANAQDNFIFSMVPTGGTEACIPKAKGRVTISPTLGLVENMHVEASGLPPNTDFDLFVIQVPTAPFGLSWYMGDMLTDANGVAVNDFIGRFNIGTFIVAPGAAPAPKVLNKPPFPDASTNLGKEGPVQLYHLGLWFDTPTDANQAGCGTVVTPFNSTHNAGVQILNTSNFSNNFGPLRHVE